MEIPNIDFDASRREREKVEKQIHFLWIKWDKQSGPIEEDQNRIKGELSYRIHMYRNEKYTSAVENAISSEQEALIGYKYKDMNIVEFLTM